MDRECEIMLRLVQKGEIVAFQKHLEYLETLRGKENWGVSLGQIIRKSTGDSVLHVAARYGKIEILKYLIENGCSANQENLDGKTALHDAAQFSHCECLNFLLENGANVNAVKKADWTPLMLACTKNDFEIVETLLKYRAEPKFCNKDGWNCFHIACREGNLDIVRLLFQKQDLVCSPSRNGRRPIHTAVMHGHEKIVEFILDKHGNEINGEDNCGTTPILDSCRFGFVEIFKMLVRNGADLQTRNKIRQNCLHVAAEANNDEIIRILVNEHYFDVNSPGGNGMTPLHYAVKEEHEKSVACLLELRGSLDLQDDQGRRCIDLAISLNKQEILKTNLLENP